MGYSKEVYEAVNRLLEQRRRKATREAEERKNRIYRQFPRIGEIQRESRPAAGTGFYFAPGRYPSG